MFRKEANMYSTFHVYADELTDTFTKSLKTAYQGKKIEIIVQEIQDETEYLLKSEANKAHLLQAIKDIENGKPGHTITIEEIEKMCV